MSSESNRHLLVVEDDDAVAEMIEIAFQGEGWDVTRVSDGPSALLAVPGADVVVLDWMLPGLDGRSVLDAIRSAGLDVPVIMVTARTEVTDKVSALAAADDYLTKPFDIDELIARVGALARRSGGAAASRIALGSLVVDTATREVLVDGCVVPLTPTEYRLVEVLATNAGRAVSRFDLLTEVWGFDFGGNRANLDTVVSAVRRKLGDVDVIETVRGYGYLIRRP